MPLHMSQPSCHDGLLWSHKVQELAAKTIESFTTWPYLCHAHIEEKSGFYHGYLKFLFKNGYGGITLLQASHANKHMVLALLIKQLEKRLVAITLNHKGNLLSAMPQAANSAPST